MGSVGVPVGTNSLTLNLAFQPIKSSKLLNLMALSVLSLLINGTRIWSSAHFLAFAVNVPSLKSSIGLPS